MRRLTGRATRIRTAVNLLITMLLGGLWHGAAWGFIVWGFMHGLGLVWSRFLSKRVLVLRPRLRLILFWTSTQVWVVLAWVFFRSPSVEFAARYIGQMFHFSEKFFNIHEELVALSAFALIPIVHHVGAPMFVRLSRRVFPWVMGLITAIVLILDLIIASPPGRPFIYFRF